MIFNAARDGIGPGEALMIGVQDQYVFGVTGMDRCGARTCQDHDEQDNPGPTQKWCSHHSGLSSGFASTAIIPFAFIGFCKKYFIAEVKKADPKFMHNADETQASVISMR